MDKQIEKLIDAYLDEELDAESAHALENWIQSDPANADQFLQAVSLHWDVYSQLKASKALDAVEENAAAREPVAADGAGQTPETRRGAPLLPFLTLAKEIAQQPLVLLTIVVAVLAGAFLAYQLSQTNIAVVHRQPHDPPPAPLAENRPAPQLPATKGGQPAPVIAHFAQGVDAVWSLEGSHRPTVGTPLRAGTRLVLSRGLAKVAFATGATVILEGPAEFTVGGTETRSDDERGRSAPSIRRPQSAITNSCSLLVGKLVARVPTEAHGFTVVTPTMTIVDRGTQFGVWVKTNSELQIPNSLAEVQVFEGRVDVYPQLARAVAKTEPPARPIEVKAGQRAVSDLGSPPRLASDANGISFVRDLPGAVQLQPLATRPKDSPLKPGDIVAVANAPTEFHLFKIDPRTGKQKLLATGFPFRQVANDHGLQWYSVAVEPDGNVLVGVAGLGAKVAGVLRIDPRSGRIKVLASGGLLTQGAVTGLAVAADGTIYATYESTIHGEPDPILKIDPASGAVTPLARFGANAGGIYLDAGGRDALIATRESQLGILELGAKPKLTPWIFDRRLGRFDCVAVNHQGRIFVGTVQPGRDGDKRFSREHILEMRRGAREPVRTILVAQPDVASRVSLACEADGNLVVGPGGSNHQIFRIDVNSGQRTVVSSGGMIEDETFLAVVPGIVAADAR